MRGVGLVDMEDEDMNGDGYGKYEEWSWVHKFYVHGLEMGSKATGWAGVNEVGGESVVMCLVDWR